VLDDAEGRVSDISMNRLIMRALELTEEPGLGLYHGLQLKLSTHGIVGLAAMTSATLGEAIRVAIRYAQLRAPHLRLDTGVEGDEAYLSLDFAVPKGDPMHVFLAESHVAALTQMASMLVGRPSVGRAELSYPEPAHVARLMHLLP